jgi:hypothetical protein
MKAIFSIFVVLLSIVTYNFAFKEKNVLTNNQPVKVTLHKTDEQFELRVNNEPFYIKGAGLEFGEIPSLAEHNGNSFRTWRTDNGKQTAQEILDEAHKHGLLVTMGIEVARERHGFDYNDAAAVKEQYDRIEKEITPLKDHPALLMWAVGNELNHESTNPKVWDAVNELSKMIHRIDPNHLTTTTLAGINQKYVNYIKERCTDIDLLSFQVYGDLEQLPKMVKKYNWEGAYMVTEWGATGHWEVAKTSWGAPIEDNSTVKANNYLKRYRKGVETNTTQCVGSYVFLWGQKQERTPTWYGIFLEDGKETEAVDVMHYLWNESWPTNKTPQVVSFELNGKNAYGNVLLKPNENCIATVKIQDDEKDNLSYRWEVLAESTDLQEGGDHEGRPDSISISIDLEKDGTLHFKAPKAGAYRLFVYANDGFNHAATANIPFFVQ